MKKILIICLLCVFGSCNQKQEKNAETTPVTSKEDYNTYLSAQDNSAYEAAQSQKEFWNKRLAADSSGVGDLGPLAGGYAALFAATGDVENLHKAEQLQKKAIAISATNKDGYTRALAKTYISQHRFKEAKKILEESYKGVSNKHETELMLFDVYMELGKYDKAYTMLNNVKNNSDFNYLIRVSKWNDHKGDLDAAIKYMDKAKTIAESGGNKSLKVWSYSNLADFYGHAGRINDSYNYYLKTLELEPDNPYVKKGLAWIAYSYEKDTKEANRILDSVLVNHKSPNYYLLKAEMAEYTNNKEAVKANEDKFVEMVSDTLYGGMYNTYLIELYAEKAPEKALALAKKEVGNRATPETYSLLALAQLKSGNKNGALQTIEAHVAGKTFEPMAQYYSAMVYKANGMEDKVKPLKEELSGAWYEMGPVLSKKIAQL
ncbi:tetratricopeptide repeat protein [Marixanthomonas spongiae]|uniref:Cell surface protein n=1 Tax=Marixanthomonas spongiae TaxID=2174845 RepID=A0A2U0HRW4_9FLAO|nr:hypothetical protein [Marixanthomonas spongiae]PVW11611.1 hypothetical protein DDV96_15655 [Marixanthomonas spongiae]